MISLILYTIVGLFPKNINVCVNENYFQGYACIYGMQWEVKIFLTSFWHEDMCEDAQKKRSL